MTPSRFHIVLAGTVLAATFVAPEAPAVGTRTFTISSMDELKGGDLTGVSVDSTGAVRAGLTFGKLPITDAQSTWSSVQLPDGAALVGTGAEGKVFKVDKGQAKLVQKVDAIAVSSMAIGWNGSVFGGGLGEGAKVFTIDANGTGGDAKAFATLPDTEAVWDLAFDAKAKVLYAATGPKGLLYRIDQNGKAQVFFDSDEAHLMSVAVASDGSVYAGSHGKGLLYKVTGPGRASVVHDFDADEVKALAFNSTGALFAVTNSHNEPWVLPRRNKDAPGRPQVARPPRPGKGTVYRIVKDATPEKLLHENDTHFVSLAIGDDGNPYVGTGAEGRIYTVNDNLVSRIVADAEERQVGALVMAGKKKYFVTTDPVVYHEVTGTGGAAAVWTSKVLDAGIRASWGRLSWRSEGNLDLETRSGSTLIPDATWSGWGGALTAPGDVKSPAARYVQIRSRLKDANAVLREVTLSFVTDNLRATVTHVEASSKANKSGLKTGIQSSGGEIGRTSYWLSLSWKIDNPDQDEIRYRLSYRLDGDKTWHPLLKPTDKLTRTSWEWDTSTLAEGIYRVKVEASDELANPPDKVLKHELESGTILVDNTPPVFKTLSLKGRKLSGEVVDGLGPVARIEIALAGTEEWRPISPSDGIFDEASEPFNADVSSIIPTGAVNAAVRAYDLAGNVVVRTIPSQ